MRSTSKKCPNNKKKMQQQKQERTASTEKTVAKPKNTSIIAAATGRQRQPGVVVRISASIHSTGVVPIHGLGVAFSAS